MPEVRLPPASVAARQSASAAIAGSWARPRYASTTQSGGPSRRRCPWSSQSAREHHAFTILRVVGRENKNVGAAHHRLQPMPCTVHEFRVACQDPFVHQQDLGLDRCGESKAQADHHARRVDTDRKVQEIAQSGELRHILLQPWQGGPRHAVVQAAQHDVLAAGQLQVHAEAGVQQCVQAALHPHAADHRLVDTGQRSQQSGLSRAVGTDQSKPVPATQVEADVAQRLHDDATLPILTEPPRRSGHHGLLQASRVAVVQRKEDRDAFDKDVWIGHCRHRVIRSRRRFVRERE